MENINFRGIPTSLFLNGPNLEIVNNPQNVTNVIGVATFTGIATATATDELDGGSIDFKWYYNGSQLLDTSEDYTSVASISTFDTPSGTGSTMTINGQNSNLNGKEVYFTVDYNPSAYQSESPVTAGTARSTANAPNEPLQSTVATISVEPEIEITSQPDPTSVVLNETASYSVEARTIPGNGPVNYQWQLDGNNLVDGSSSTIVQETSTGIITLTGGADTTIDFSEVSSYDQFTPGQTYTLTTDRDIIVRVHLEGGSGGNDEHYNRGGGTGGLSVGTITLLQGQNYILVVGERGNDSYIPQDSRYNQSTNSLGGYPGGASGNLGGGGGGGFTGLFLGSSSNANSLIIAGGAGGGGTFGVDGGDGGGLNGENGEESGNPDGSGDGGTQTAGGGGGAPGGSTGGGLNSLVVNGGNGGPGSGGGGGGYFGGGGGSLRNLYMSGSGGGGSSYFSNVVSDTTTTTGGAAGGDGYARIDVVSSPKTVTTVVSGSQTNNLLIRTDDNAAGTIRCSVSANNVQQSPVFSRSVSYYSYTARNVLNIEQYDYTNSSATLTSHNLANGTLTLDNSSYPGNAICLYAPEKDVEVEIDMHGGKGSDNGSNSGGDGGYSRIRFTMDKNEEYILTGLFSSINAPFLYRKSSLIAVVGEGGGAATTLNSGGSGGGINLGGQGGQGARGGAGASVIQAGNLPEDGRFGSLYLNIIEAVPPDQNHDDVFGSGNATGGGRTIPCTRGVYWREQGKSACEDLGTIKFRIPDGTELSNTAEIDRGYKSGYNVIQTKGAQDSGAGQGGSGATGGSGGSNSEGGGGGGSGYTDGSVQVLTTQQGSSSYDNATIIISQLTPVSVTQDIVDNQGTTSEVNPFSIARYTAPGLSGTEGHPVGSLLYTVNILDYTNPTLTARVLNTSLRGSGINDPNNSIAVSAGYPRMVSANTFEVAFDMISSQNANERQATFVRNFELTVTANVSNFGS